jgi:hypothetical protein
MKYATLPSRRFRFKLSVLGALTASAAMFGWPEQAAAESVDSELLLLVDSTQRGLNNRDFNELLDGYADAFASSDVLNAIQSGIYGKIAVSLMFFGNASTQVVGIPWMSIGNAAEAQTFALLLRAIDRPASPGTIQVDDALLAAIPFFGTETGAAGNGFESTAQIVEVVAATTPAGGSTAGVPSARDQALASGVDVINAIAVGKQAGTMEAYYASNVIGGEAGGVVATSSSSALDGSLSGFLSGRVSGQVTAGAMESLTSVPEPSSWIALVSGMGLLILRRRRPAC